MKQEDYIAAEQRKINLLKQQIKQTAEPRKRIQLVNELHKLEENLQQQLFS